MTLTSGTRRFLHVLINHSEGEPPRFELKTYETMVLALIDNGLLIVSVTEKAVAMLAEEQDEEVRLRTKIERITREIHELANFTGISDHDCNEVIDSVLKLGKL